MSSKNCRCGSEAQEAGCEAYRWRRSGPVLPLLDAKFVGLKPTVRPIVQLPKLDCSKEFFGKLKQKFPHLCANLKDSTLEDLLLRVERDRLKTTYQQDFGGLDSETFKDEDCLLAIQSLLAEDKRKAHGSEGSASKGGKGDKGGKGGKGGGFSSKASASGGASKDDHGAKNGDGVEDAKPSNGSESSTEKFEGGMEIPLPPWKSEYQSVIAKTGEAILKYRLYCRRKGKSRRASLVSRNSFSLSK